MHLLLLLLRSKYGYFMRRLERLCMHAREGKKLGRGPRQVASAHNPVITQQARSCLLLYCTVAFLYCTVRATRFKISKSVAYVPVFPFRYARVRVERERESARPGNDSGKTHRRRVWILHSMYCTIQCCKYSTEKSATNLRGWWQPVSRLLLSRSHSSLNIPPSIRLCCDTTLHTEDNCVAQLASSRSLVGLTSVGRRTHPIIARFFFFRLEYPCHQNRRERDPPALSRPKSASVNLSC